MAGGAAGCGDAWPETLQRFAYTSGRWLEMARALVAADASVLPLLVDAAEARLPLRDDIRHTAASFLALRGVLRAPGFDALSELEAETGLARLEAALREMGWVFWVAEARDYFITPSAPLQVAYPKADEGWIEEMDLRSPGTESTFPLTPRVAIHATWRRLGETWRRAG